MATSKFGDALVHMISDFANLRRSPDAKAKSDEQVIASSSSSPLSSGTPSQAQLSSQRRHSINLAVGVSDEIPPFSIPANRRARRQSAVPTTSTRVEEVRAKGRRQSAPAVSDINSLHRKLAKLRDTSSLKDAFEECDEDEAANSRRGSQQVAEADVKMLKQPAGASIDSNEIASNASQDTTSGKMSAVSPSEIKAAKNLTKDRIKYYNEHRGSIIFIDDDQNFEHIRSRSAEI